MQWSLSSFIFLCGRHPDPSVMDQSQTLTFHFHSQSNLKSFFFYDLFPPGCRTALVNIISDFKSMSRGAPLIRAFQWERGGVTPGCSGAADSSSKTWCPVRVRGLGLERGHDGTRWGRSMRLCTRDTRINIEGRARYIINHQGALVTRDR